MGVTECMGMHVQLHYLNHVDVTARLQQESTPLSGASLPFIHRSGIFTNAVSSTLAVAGQSASYGKKTHRSNTLKTFFLFTSLSYHHWVSTKLAVATPVVWMLNVQIYNSRWSCWTFLTCRPFLCHRNCMEKKDMSWISVINSYYYPHCLAMLSSSSSSQQLTLRRVNKTSHVFLFVYCHHGTRSVLYIATV